MLEANPDHWSHPKIHRWIMRIMPNVEASMGALKSGEINFLTDYTGDPQLLKDLAKSQPNIEVARRSTSASSSSPTTSGARRSTISPSARRSPP